MERISIPFSIFLPACLALLASQYAFVAAQPSPEVQQRISAAISAASNATDIDYTAFVNPFIGSANFGNTCPAASRPFGMVKFSVDNTGYAPAGYVANGSEHICGLSPLHDCGTGASLGSYGNFEIMPLLCPGGFATCTTRLSDRLRLRKANTDDAYPGYFSLTLDNEIKMEATSTRRAGLEKFTFPSGNKPYFVLDLARDLAASFSGGSMDIDPQKGRITIGGHWKPSWGPPSFLYQAFACYDLTGNGQQLDEYGMWTGDNFGLDQKVQGVTRLNYTNNLIGGVYESGALFSYKGNLNTVIIRVGISFVSTDQACANAESEIGSTSFEDIVKASRAQWQDKLKKVQIDVPNTPPNVTEMIYSSLYRSFLTPNNATGEAQGVMAGTSSPYFDSLYCSWDTFRTFFPFMSLHSPAEFAEIVETYIDAYRKNGWLTECRANNMPGWTQGGSDGDNIVSHFAIAYHNEASNLGVDINELYSALKKDAEVTPPDWDIYGRQADIYKHYGYVPYAVFDPTSVGRQTREGSRTQEYSVNDFGLRQVALLLNNADDVNTYTNRSFSYRNVWDPSVDSDGFKGFMQKRFPNGTFANRNPKDCSPQDNDQNRQCSLTSGNENGFYESSSWEYSFFSPHDTEHLIELMGGNDTFVRRLDHFFDAGYYLAGNEPSFQTPIGYHYANRPAKSVERVRKVVAQNFGIGSDGLPGNDDQGAMATLLLFHLLGLYPVPSTSQLLILSPFTPRYTIYNDFLHTNTTVTVKNFDPNSVQENIPAGASAYVQNVTINGQPTSSRCYFDFYDTFRLGGNIEITLTANKDSVDNCAGPVPESLSTGGFAKVR